VTMCIVTKFNSDYRYFVIEVSATCIDLIASTRQFKSVSSIVYVQYEPQPTEYLTMLYL